MHEVLDKDMLALRATAMCCGSGDRACCSASQDHVKAVLYREQAVRAAG